MAELRIRAIDESELDTVLAEDFEFDGTIEFRDPLLVKGELHGEIRAESDLFIAESARVEADVQAMRVSIKGRVHGDIDAIERVEMFATARVSGNIRTPDLIIQSGSRFTGQCEMPADEGEASGE